MKTDTLARRLRFAPPNPVVRRLIPSEADYAIFEAINRHGPLPTHYLYEFTRHIRKDYTHLQNRLTEFYNGDEAGPYLVRPPQQFAGFEARYQHIVYDLAPRARVLLADRGSALLKRHAPKRTDPFLHQLMQACVGASLERTAQKAGLRYITREEILTHPKCPEATRDSTHPMVIPLHGFGEKGALVPDDLFGLEYPGVGFRFFAVEIDRNTESIERKNFDQNSFGRKIAGYLQVLKERTYQDWWGIPNLSVLTVTTSAGHAFNLLEHIKKQGEQKHAERFAFAVESSFGSNWRVPRALLSDLLEKPWATVGKPKIIAQP